jgi:hypothetical protein
MKLRTLFVQASLVGLAACSSAPPTASGSAASPSAGTPADAPAPVAAGSAQPAANAVDPAVIQALNNMGKYLQTLRQFEVFIDLSGERVLADGRSCSTPPRPTSTLRDRTSCGPRCAAHVPSAS